MIRKEAIDTVYRTEEEKFGNAAKEIKKRHDLCQPVLVGTISVEKSEKLAGILKKMGVKLEVLNAKNHEREATIVAQAGRKGAVTVSTNMAGRGTDILLGGNPEVQAREHLRRQSIDPEQMPKDQWQATLAKFKEETDRNHEEVVALGGLHIVATERHESRRIDNQLRGRAGRQGDPGSSRFYLSLQDDLLRIFGGERMQNLMLRLGMEEDMPIESKLITKRIAAAQKAVEAQNFESRKHLLEYDDIMNKQRQYIYGMRRQLLEGVEQKDEIVEMVRDAVERFVDMRCPEKVHVDTYDFEGFRTDVLSQFGVKLHIPDLQTKNRAEIEDYAVDLLMKKYQEKEDLIGSDIMRQTERMVMLQVIDDQWKDHLLSIDELKQGIGMRGYGQKDPLVEYKKESYDLFTALQARIDEESLRYLFFLQVTRGERPALPFPDEDDFEDEEEAVVPQPTEAERAAAQNSLQDFTRNIQRKKEKELAELQFVGGDTSGNGHKQAINNSKVGRNDPCPCGSGKKYKKCHGQAA